MHSLRLLALAAIACLGCGEKPSVAPVTGIVTFDGQPLVGASITTQPIATDSSTPGLGSFGQTDEQGWFELELVKPAVKGAIIGEHRVMISPADSGTTGGVRTQVGEGGEEFRTDDPNANRAAVQQQKKWPASFSDGSLRLQVPAEGKADVRFDLTR